MSKGSAVVAILIAFVGGLFMGHLLPRQGGDQVAVDETVEVIPGSEGTGDPASTRLRVPVTAQQASKGPADALVTIVEFSDFQCPFCSRVNPTMATIMERYRGKVRVVWRNAPLPFHDNAVPAAEAAMEAMAQGGSAKFWQMHDVLFQNQNALTRPDLERYAQQINLDMTRFRRAMDQHTHQRAVEADNALARQIGANGTPNFFINGKNLVGAQPVEAFVTVIDAELAEAERLVASGTARNRVYDTLMRGARTTPAPAAAPAAGDAPAPAPARPNAPDPAATYKVELPAGLPQNGPSDALVTVVQVSDYQCPFCSRVEPTMAQLRTDYRNDLRVVWLDNPLPFHPNAKPAAIAALEAFEQGGNAKFWQLHDKLFEHQATLERANIETYAQEVGLNMGQLRAALDNNEHAAQIDASQALARRFGASGTPAFFINGRFLSGARPLEQFKALVDEEMAKARALVAAGTPRAQVYARTVASGLAQVAAAPAAPAGAAPAAPDAPDPNRIYNIPIPAGAATRGPANARVTLQLFSDFQCPFCSRIGPAMQQIIAEYGTRVRIVWRDYPLPFHPNAKPAAEAAREVLAQGGAAKFWAYHDLLFQNQQNLDRPTLERLAQQVGGIDMNRFRQALDSHRHQAAVDADMAAIQAAGINQFGTPTSFINGKMLSGAMPFEAFKTAIDAALAAPR
jgi:protein-disulfide isomerase